MKTKSKFYVICMSFDGEYQKEPYFFDSIDEAAEYASGLGSKWFFYPFDFICKGKTIVNTGYGLHHYENKRISTMQKAMQKLNDYCCENDISMSAEEFWFAL